LNVADELIGARKTATFCLMMTDEKNMETGIRNLARAHADAAIQVLVEIMSQPDAPAGARLSAAKALLDLGWGKATTKKANEERRVAPLTPVTSTIIDPKRPEPENPLPQTAPPEYPSERCTHRGYDEAAYVRSPAAKQAFRGQRVEDEARRPPTVGDCGDRTMASCDGWG
jgi:hypothetical protein